MTLRDQSDTRLAKGTRRLHRASGEVWRLKFLYTPIVPVGVPLKVCLVAETDQRERAITAADWLDDSKWARPRSREGARA